jgi:formylmethanofuran dehydrogenase subunit E-like metal-binding protein
MSGPLAAHSSASNTMQGLGQGIVKIEEDDSFVVFSSVSNPEQSSMYTICTKDEETLVLNVTIDESRAEVESLIGPSDLWLSGVNFAISVITKIYRGREDLVERLAAVKESCQQRAALYQMAADNRESHAVAIMIKFRNYLDNPGVPPKFRRQCNLREITRDQLTAYIRDDQYDRGNRRIMNDIAQDSTKNWYFHSAFEHPFDDGNRAIVEEPALFVALVEQLAPRLSALLQEDRARRGPPVRRA